MRSTFTILFLIMGFCLVTSAQNENFELQLLNNAKISLPPGVTTNLVIRLGNNTRVEELINLKLQLPNGWRCFSDLNSILASQTQSTIKILCVNIPSKTPAGDYFINIQAYNKHGIIIGEVKIPVTIEPKYGLKIEFINGPEYVFAGDTLFAQFMVQNLSNSKTEIIALVKGFGKDDKMSFTLNPESSMLITKKIKTENGIYKSIQRNLVLSAFVVGKPEVNASKSYLYNVIPSVDIKFDPYNRFPFQFSTLLASDNSLGVRLYALMFDIEGKGFLNENKTKELNFQFLGPNRQGKPLYGIYEQYFMEYKSPKSAFSFGDENYQLSYLTEQARYARGGSAKFLFRNFTIGSFIDYPRFYPKIKREASIYSGYSIPDKIILNIGYLNKLSNLNDINHLVTFNGTGTPFKWAKLNWEYSLGMVGKEYKQAYNTTMNINIRSVQLYYNYIMAQKGFPGYFNDTQLMIANASFTLSHSINIGVNYALTHSNMALDTLYGGAPYSKILFCMLNYSFMNDGIFSLGYHYQEMQDRIIPMKFNNKENLIRLFLNKRFGNFRLNLVGEYGNTKNLLLPEKEQQNDLYRIGINMGFRISRGLNIGNFVNYQQSKSYNVNDYKNWTYGGFINGSISKKLSLLINYQNSYSVEEYYRDRSILDGRLIYNPNKNNRFEATARYDLTKNSLNNRELAYTIRFIHTFNVPVSKKKNLGKLSGQIINKGVKTVEGIVLSIGYDQAVTDKNGNYSFPMLPAGNYYLMIDYSQAGVFAVPETPGPYPIEILPGRESRFDIALTLAAKITGEVSILKDISDEDKTYAGIRDRLGKLLVEAKNGSEVYRIFTKEDGQFAFESLRPGPWTVRVYEAGIPKEYQLVTDQFNIGLASGKEEHIEVKIKEVRRRIKFQKSIENTPDFETTKPAVPGSKKTDSSNKNSKPVKTAKTMVKTPEKISRVDTAQVKKQIRVVSESGKEQKSTSQNLEYRIQLGSYDKPLASTDKLAAKLSITEKIQEDLFNGHYIYTIGSYKSPREAAARNKEIQKNADTSNSFIVSFRDGARTPKLEKPELAEK